MGIARSGIATAVIGVTDPAFVACGSGGVLAVRGYPASPGYAPVAPFPTALDGGISDAVLVFAREKG